MSTNSGLDQACIDGQFAVLQHQLHMLELDSEDQQLVIDRVPKMRKVIRSAILKRLFFVAGMCSLLCSTQESDHIPRHTLEARVREEQKENTKLRIQHIADKEIIRRLQTELIRRVVEKNDTTVLSEE